MSSAYLSEMEQLVVALKTAKTRVQDAHMGLVNAAPAAGVLGVLNTALDHLHEALEIAAAHRQFEADMEAAFSEPLPAEDDAEIEASLRRLRAAIPVARVINDNRPGNTATIEVYTNPPTLPVGTLLYAGHK